MRFFSLLTQGRLPWECACKRKEPGLQILAHYCFLIWILWTPRKPQVRPGLLVPGMGRDYLVLPVSSIHTRDRLEEGKELLKHWLSTSSPFPKKTFHGLEWSSLIMRFFWLKDCCENYSHSSVQTWKSLLHCLCPVWSKTEMVITLVSCLFV